MPELVLKIVQRGQKLPMLPKEPISQLPPQRVSIRSQPQASIMDTTKSNEQILPDLGNGCVDRAEILTQRRGETQIGAGDDKSENETLTYLRHLRAFALKSLRFSAPLRLCVKLLHYRKIGGAIWLRRLSPSTWMKQFWSLKECASRATADYTGILSATSPPNPSSASFPAGMPPSSSQPRAR